MGAKRRNNPQRPSQSDISHRTRASSDDRQGSYTPAWAFARSTGTHTAGRRRGNLNRSTVIAGRRDPEQRTGTTGLRRAMYARQRRRVPLRQKQLSVRARRNAVPPLPLPLSLRLRPQNRARRLVQMRLCKMLAPPPQCGGGEVLYQELRQNQTTLGGEYQITVQGSEQPVASAEPARGTQPPRPREGAPRWYTPTTRAPGTSLSPSGPTPECHPQCLVFSGFVDSNSYIIVYPSTR